jgi:hypothetical protein
MEYSFTQRRKVSTTKNAKTKTMKISELIYLENFFALLAGILLRLCVKKQL